MPRGRKKDSTIPPTRSLLQQRDYRARKANYVSELEERCWKAEEENQRLRKELELVRAYPSSYASNPLAIEISAELMQSLANASASLAKFQDLARQHPLPTRALTLTEPPTSAPKALEVTESPHYSQSESIQSIRMSPTNCGASEAHRRGHTDTPKTLHSHPSTVSPVASQLQHDSNTIQPSTEFPQQPVGSNTLVCCDGYFDCDSLCETGSEYSDGDGPPIAASRISNERAL
ncbi:hypothetical protein FA15DRAFT_103201 [Coprinopsis marcescibilis]|uniref:BZIP domain-containing protein n=1 Tax=Coprinopsis marcescibilis TaxID=230819 RepID=A0A5C3KKX9_COPMA|nr:hypothetical protein FA15DRAFT_103201 [Coprinopsis marcescibilis]